MKKLMKRVTSRLKKIAVGMSESSYESFKQTHADRYYMKDLTNEKEKTAEARDKHS